MSSTQRRLCIAYGIVAVVALIGTWSQNLAYFRADEGFVGGFVFATLRFWPATLATPASTSIAIDLAVFFAAASVFMVREARRSAGCGPTSCSAS